MGGGGAYYHRDTSDGYARSSAGVSVAAEQLMSQKHVDPGVLPKNRRIASKAKSPVVYIFDDTGSMGNLPKIIADKMPMIAGQTVQNGYLTDVELSLAAVGDIQFDHAPVQIGDFTQMKLLDDWLKRLWIEHGGGSNDVESYEFMAYFYARYCDFSNAVTPICLFTADEGISQILYKSDLERIFGGTHETISTVDVFKELDRKFKGNVFLIHKYYGHGDAKALSGWQQCLGDKRIIRLGTDQSIADLTLGLFALVAGTRTLDAYLDDMVTMRARAQTAGRIEEVRKALTPLVVYLQARADGKSISDSIPQNETEFPSPDDLNRLISGEITDTLNNYLSNLAALLQSEKRPLPDTDGWVYCEDLRVPKCAFAGSCALDYLYEILGKANWDAELNRHTSTLRIRRKS